jgi:penicillin-binding protein activator
MDNYGQLRIPPVFAILKRASRHITNVKNSARRTAVTTIRILAVMILGLLILSGCGASKTVTRVEPNEQIDLSGDWNDTDSRLVAEGMIKDVLGQPWLTGFTGDKKRTPVVIVGTVRNRTTEHIATTAFIKNLERELINSGRVEFVANKEERQEVRDERQDQQEFSSAETLKKFQQETGADFMLRGDITSIVDAEGGQQVKYYQVNLELVNIETNKKAWIGEKKIKKLVAQSGSKF